MSALPHIHENRQFTADAMRLHDNAGSIEIAHYQGTRRLTPAELHAADVEAGRWQSRHPVSPVRPTPVKRRSRIHPGHFFALTFTAAVILIAWHMSDAYARALADIQQIEVRQ